LIFFPFKRETNFKDYNLKKKSKYFSK